MIALLIYHFETWQLSECFLSDRDFFGRLGAQVAFSGAYS